MIFTYWINHTCGCTLLCFIIVSAANLHVTSLLLHIMAQCNVCVCARVCVWVRGVIASVGGCV